MEYQGESKISPKYKKEDYRKIKLKLDSCQEDWYKAVEIFDDRLNSRYFGVIDLLLKTSEIETTGFSIMAINCLLIETLMQFRNGLDITPTRRNKEMYSDFLMREFTTIFTKEKVANNFYKNIRCAILHSAQTKKGSKLNADYNCGFTVKNSSLNIEVNVQNFTKELQKYYSNYKSNLLEKTNNSELRKNFIVKMDLLCKYSD
ncbi:MAG: hypothetical protein ACRC17_06260 [Culicoidibacterales bacterium]